MFHKFISTVIILLALCGCSCSSDGKKAESYTSKEAYELGRKHGSNLVSDPCDEESLQDSLLDVRARIYHISVTVGKPQAEEYERGFTDAVKDGDPALAARIF